MKFDEFAASVNFYSMPGFDKALYCLYWLKNEHHITEATITDIIKLITSVGLPEPNSTRLSTILRKSRKVVAPKKGFFRLHPLIEKGIKAYIESSSPPSSPPPSLPSIPSNVPFFVESDVSLAKAMSEVFVLIHCIENSARNLIRAKLEAAYGANWLTRVCTKGMAKKIKDRQIEEAKNKWHQPRGAHPLNYLDFGDLKDLIVNNWPYFKDLFPDQHWICSHLSELEKSRNVIAHNNILEDIEVTRIRIYFSDWCKQVSIT